MRRLTAFLGLCMTLGFLTSILSSAVTPLDEAQANGRALNRGYFFNQTLTEGFNVLEAGLPQARVGTNKELFIQYILERWENSTRYGDCPGVGCDYAGAAYIIQTMRGPDAAGNWDHSYPDAADIADWEAKVREPNVQMRWGYEGAAYGGGITTDRFISGGERDVAQTNGTTAGKTVAFYNAANPGQIYYLIRESCANPLGNLSGLPAPTPPPQWDLLPSITGDRSGVVSIDDNVTVTPSVANAGDTAPDVAWEVSQFVVLPGGSYPQTTQSNALTPSQQYRNGWTLLRSGNESFSKGTKIVGRSTQIIPDIPGGSKICYALSVQPYNQSTTNWRHSAPYCLVIGKKPTVQIWGSDLRIGAAFMGQTPRTSGINTSITTKSAKTYGSWVEYGVFAPSSVLIASQSGLSGGNTSSAQRDWSRLTFANQPTQNCPAGASAFGCYNSAASMGVIPDVEGYFYTTGSPTGIGASMSVGGAGGGVHVYKRTGNLTITGGTVPAGQSYIVRATGTVTITGDMQYTNGKLTSISDIPQVVIIANRINIAPNVTNIDAWLIAEGSATAGTGILDTCAISANYATPLTVTSCNNALRVNGPVMAQKLWLRRTAGANAGAASGEPAEIFNLRSDAYLWAMSQVRGGGKAQTKYTTELPPRF